MKVTLENVRFSQVYVHTAGKPFDADAKEKYSIHGIVAKDSPVVAQMKAAILAAAKEVWSDKAEAKLKAIAAVGKIWCLRDGDVKPDNPAYAGNYFVAAKNEIRPLVVGGGPDGRAPLVASDGKPYPGSYGNLILDVRASDLPTPQIFAYLLGVQFVKDGERLSGGGVAAADDFKPLPGTDAAKAAATGNGAAALF
jgi:hypothetical protein